MDTDLVLEQYLSLGSPMIAGFRLEAFSAIKPRVTHSPSSDVQIWDASVTFLEDRHIYPAVLYLQVCTVQVINGLFLSYSFNLETNVAKIQSAVFSWTAIMHRRILFSHFKAWFVSSKLSRMIVFILMLSIFSSSRISQMIKPGQLLVFLIMVIIKSFQFDCNHGGFISLKMVSMTLYRSPTIV